MTGVATDVPADGAPPPDRPSGRVDKRASNRGDVTAVARGGLAQLVGAVVSAVANFGLVIVVTRYEDAAAAGVFFSITSMFLIAETIVRLGGDVGAVYFPARWRTADQEDRVGPVLAVALGLAALASAVVAVAMLVLAPQIASWLDAPRSSVGLIRLLAVLLPVAALYDTALGATRGLGSQRPTVVIEKILRPAAQVVLALLVLAAGWKGGLGVAWGVPYVAGVVMAYAAMRVALRRVVGDTVVLAAAALRLDRAGLRTTAREYLAFSLPRALANTAQVVLQRLDIVLVAVLQGAVAAAVYTAATRFLVVGQFLNQAITAPLQPRLAAALGSGDVTRANDIYRISTCWLVLVSWPVFGVVSVFASLYLAVFGGGYTSGTAVAVVVILAFSMLLASAVGVVDSVLVMAGRSSWSLSMTIGALIVNVAVDLALIPHIGILGAAIGWCAAIVWSNVVPLVLVWRSLRMNPFGPTVVSALVSTTICFGVLPGVGLAVSLPFAAVGLAVGVVVFVAYAWRRREEFELTSFLRRGRRAA